MNEMKLSNIDTNEKIRILCKRRGLSISELARRIGMSSQNLSNKLTRNNFPESELIVIAKELNCKYVSYFEEEDGKIL